MNKPNTNRAQKHPWTPDFQLSRNRVSRFVQLYIYRGICLAVCSSSTGKLYIRRHIFLLAKWVYQTWMQIYKSHSKVSAISDFEHTKVSYWKLLLRSYLLYTNQVRRTFSSLGKTCTKENIYSYSIVRSSVFRMSIPSQSHIIWVRPISCLGFCSVFNGYCCALRYLLFCLIVCNRSIKIHTVGPNRQYIYSDPWGRVFLNVWARCVPGAPPTTTTWFDGCLICVFCVVCVHCVCVCV